MTMNELYKEFGLQPDTAQFISHSMCLRLDELHMNQPALATVNELKTYMYSLMRYGTSPYIYPCYGLGGLPEGFSRICAIHGGTFMLNRDVDEILFSNDGKAYGIKCSEDGKTMMAKAPMIIGDPSYFSQDKIKATSKVVRCICLLNHPVPNTAESESVQIVIPGPQVGRVNDVFVCSMGQSLHVTAPGVYVAIVSTIAEKGDPDEDLVSGLRLLGPILKRFTNVSQVYEPVADGSSDNCYISKSFDATSHFENDCADLLSLHKRVTGEELDMNINADSVEGDY
jgi:Rab GDP dissociation inhibitor